MTRGKKGRPPRIEDSARTIEAKVQGPLRTSFWPEIAGPSAEAVPEQGYAGNRRAGRRSNRIADEDQTK
jgi:hypothetical protein